jgi:hypothetical protein
MNCLDEVTWWDMAQECGCGGHIARLWMGFLFGNWNIANQYIAEA